MTAATSYPVEPGVVTVEGADATSFLQSLLSQDLDPVAGRRARRRCSCNRRGSSSRRCTRCTSATTTGGASPMPKVRRRWPKA